MLKFGFTTGSCAAAAAKAAALMVFEKRKIEYVSIYTPKGIEFEAYILNADIDERCASCAVRKYAGDDPDVTDGTLIYVEVRLTDKIGVNIDGGAGVGRVTKAGLWQKIGEAAINKVPMQMIKDEVESVFKIYGYGGGADVIISVPEGEEIAKSTFNPRLGIEGGISILGTSGIVEPMSERALIDAIGAEIKVKKANEGDILLLSPGNYGIDFVNRTYGIDIDKALKCSNYIGAAFDMALEAGFKGALLIGHIGKLVKLAGGIMDTHSKNADCRMEIISANTALLSDDISLVREIMGCTTTDEAIVLLDRSGKLKPVMENIIQKAHFYLNNRVSGKMETAVIMFSNEFGILGKTDNALKFLNEIKENKE